MKLSVATRLRQVSDNPPQKKKCNEKRPQCDRCTERNLQCEYEAVKPRNRRKVSFAQSNGSDSPTYTEQWGGQFETDAEHNDIAVQEWETSSEFQFNALDSEWDCALDEVEDIIRANEQPVVGTLMRSRSQYPDLAMIAPSPVPSPLREFGAALFMEFTEKKNRRALVDHFCNVLSHLIVFKEDTGNPFRQLVLPLSHGSSPVTNAIFALSSAHLEYRGVENVEKSLDFHNKALQGLAQLIEKNDESRKEEVLGAIILLVYYEVVSTPQCIVKSKTDRHSSFNEAVPVLFMAI